LRGGLLGGRPRRGVLLLGCRLGCRGPDWRRRRGCVSGRGCGSWCCWRGIRWLLLLLLLPLLPPLLPPLLLLLCRGCWLLLGLLERGSWRRGGLRRGACAKVRGRVGARLVHVGAATDSRPARARHRQPSSPHLQRRCSGPGAARRPPAVPPPPVRRWGPRAPWLRGAGGTLVSCQKQLVRDGATASGGAKRRATARGAAAAAAAAACVRARRGRTCGAPVVQQLVHRGLDQPVHHRQLLAPQLQRDVHMLRAGVDLRRHGRRSGRGWRCGALRGVPG
jgi:hypothetical protein